MRTVVCHARSCVLRARNPYVAGLTSHVCPGLKERDTKKLISSVVRLQPYHSHSCHSHRSLLHLTHLASVWRVCAHVRMRVCVWGGAYVCVCVCVCAGMYVCVCVTHKERPIANLHCLVVIRFTLPVNHLYSKSARGHTNYKPATNVNGQLRSRVLGASRTRVHCCIFCRPGHVHVWYMTRSKVWRSNALQVR